MMQEPIAAVFSRFVVDKAKYHELLNNVKPEPDDDEEYRQLYLRFVVIDIGEGTLDYTTVSALAESSKVRPITWSITIDAIGGNSLWGGNNLTQSIANILQRECIKKSGIEMSYLTSKQIAIFRAKLYEAADAVKLRFGSGATIADGEFMCPWMDDDGTPYTYAFEINDTEYRQLTEKELNDTKSFQELKNVISKLDDDEQKSLTVCTLYNNIYSQSYFTIQ